MTSPYLTLPLRSEAEARIERAFRKIAAKYPASTWFARNEHSEKDILFLAYATHSELEWENDLLLCDRCEVNPAARNHKLCADCMDEKVNESNREEDGYRRARRGL